MRWFVEISPLGKGKGNVTKLCVEAPQWQPALQQARAARGDDGPIGSFSIELLDDGYRAIDPATRTRYIVRKAPDDAPLSSGAPTSKRSSVPPASGKTSTGKTDKKRAAAQTVAFGSKGVAAFSDATPAGANDARAVADVASKSALPAFEEQSHRAEEPTAKSPLTYREVVYTVAVGTSEDAAERLLRARLVDVKGSIARARGRLVNLAVFDHAFRGRPERAPIATLTWKDWKGDEPELRFPARDGAGETPTPLAPSAAKPTSPARSNGAASPASTSSASNGKAASTSAERTSATPSSGPATIPDSNAGPPKSQRITATPPTDASAATTKPAPAEPVKIADPTPSAPPQKLDEKEPAKRAVEKTLESAPVEPAAVKSTKSSAEPVIAAVDAAKLEAPKPAATKPEAKAEAPKANAADEKAAPTSDEPPLSVPAPPSSLPRLSADDLIAELFDACGDLHFLPDALEGADFILALTLEKLPSEAGMVSLFDMNKREFVVVRHSGGTGSALLKRTPERSPLVSTAMRKRHAVVVADATAERRDSDARWTALGVTLRSMICAPVELGGRYLGLIEVANPLDGGTYAPSEGHALTYIGQQFAEFVAERGVVLDPELIQAPKKKATRR
jgi:hypothetical protein